MEVVILKFRNPYSKQRKTKKEKLKLFITKSIIPYIKKAPTAVNEKVYSKFLPESIYAAKETIEFHWERKKSWTNKKPNDVQLLLKKIYISDYIPIEKIEVFNKGLKRIFSNNRAPFEHGNEERIDEFCKNVNFNLYGGLWSNFGSIKFNGDEITEFIDGIHISATHVGSSTIIAQFIITPSDNFLREFEYILDKEIKDEGYFEFQIKNFLTFWNNRTQPGTNVKHEMVEDYLLELKWIAMKEINKYFYTTLHQLKIVTPSIEVYETDRTYCELKRSNNVFWESVGMDFYKNDSSKDGYWDIFHTNGYSSGIDNPLKLVYNSNLELKVSNELGSFQGYISVVMMEFSKKIFPMLVARTYAINISELVATHRKNIYGFLAKNRPKYKKLIRIRYELEKEIQVIRRFQNEFDSNFYERTISDVDKVFEFESSRWEELNEVRLVVENTKYLLEETTRHSDDLTNIIDDAVKLLEIKTNHSIRKWSFWLTTTSIILSVIATTIAALSFFYQMDDKQREDLLKLLLPFIN